MRTDETEWVRCATNLAQIPYHSILVHHRKSGGSKAKTISILSLTRVRRYNFFRLAGRGFSFVETEVQQLPAMSILFGELSVWGLGDN